MKTKMNLLLNPFQQIAGTKALLWGILGIIATTALCTINHLHFNGLGQVAVRLENATFLPLLLEHLIIWLVPVILFYIAGSILSSSRIRIIDLLGTFAFAQLPFLLAAVVGFIPAIQQMSFAEITPEILQNPAFIKGVFFVTLFIPFMVWGIIWMFQAYKVSCNLKGVKLGVSFAILIICSDILCRIIISQLMHMKF